MPKKSSFLICGLVALLGLTACGGGSNPNPTKQPTVSPTNVTPTADNYQVNQTYWTANITQGGFFGPNSNLTLNLTMTDSAGGVERGYIANQNGNYHVNIVSEGVDLYVEALEDLSYNVYYQEEGKWEVYNTTAEYFASLSKMFTIYISPWAYSDFTYNENSHAYEKASDTITLDGVTATFTNIAFKFENGKLLSVSYHVKAEGTEYDCSITVSNWGSTVITFPDVSHGTTPTPQELRIELSETTLEMKVGDNHELTATIYPENAQVPEITWSASSDILHIDHFGTNPNVVNLKAEMEGTVVVTASIAGMATATCVVTITGNGGQILATDIVVSETELNLKVGDSVELEAYVYPLNATNRLVHWSPDQKGVVDVVPSGENNCMATVTAIGVGTCHITAIVTLGVEQIINVTVTNGGGDDPVNPTSISLSKSKIEMKVGETVTLTATVLPENAVYERVEWELGSMKLTVTPLDEKRNTVSISSREAVSTYVAAYIGNVKTRCEVVVTKDGGGDTPIEATDVVLSSETLSIKVNETATLTATVYPENATDKTVRWSYDEMVEGSPKVIDLIVPADGTSSVVVKGVNPGTINVYAQVGNGGPYAECAVTVTEEEVPPVVTDPLVNVTLKYKTFFGPTNYGEETLTEAQVDEIMGDVRLSLFAPVEGEDGSRAAAFEYYHADSPLEGVYLGNFFADGNSGYGSVDRYYNFQSQKFSFGRGIPYRDIVCNNGTLSLIYVTADEAQYYEMGDHVITAGMYLLSGYLMDDSGVVSGKGYAVFEKENDDPKHLGGIPEDATEPDLTGLLNNKLFEYTTYETSNDSFVNNERMHLEQQNASVGFFDDGTFEYHLYYDTDNGSMAPFESDRIYRGNYTIEYSSDIEDAMFGESIYCVTLNAKELIKNDEVTQLRFVYFDFYYSIRENKVIRSREELKGYGADGSVQTADMLFYFDLSDKAPEKYTPQEYDEWDAVAVSEALASLGYTDVLPKLDGVKTFEIRNVSIENGTMTIMCFFSTADKAATASNAYTRTVEATFTPVSQYDTLHGDYVLYRFSPNNQYKIDWHYSEYTKSVQIDVYNAIAAYPSSELAAYFYKLGVEDDIPSFSLDDASDYQFVSDDGAFYIFINPTEVEQAEATIVSRFEECYYEERTVSGYTFYISPNEQIAFRFVEHTYGFTVMVVDPATIPLTSFPDIKVDDYLDGVTDIRPYLGYEGDAIYAFLGPDDTYPDATVSVQFVEDYILEDEYLNNFIPSLQQLLLDNCYSLYNYVTVRNASGVERTYDNIYVSENVEIGIRIRTVRATSVDGSIVYRGYGVQFVNLASMTIIDSDDGIPDLASIEATGMTTEFNVGDEFEFDGVVTAYYVDGSSKVVAPTSISTPDMSQEGRQEVVVTYVEDGITKEFSYYISLTTPITINEYTYRNTDTYDIFEYGAQFKIWAWGGEYGKGQWVEITSINQETKDFVFRLYSNCDGFIIVRLNPDAMPSEIDVWDVQQWGKSGNLTPMTSDSGYVEFSFNG